ncbi:MAG: hypothetical protein Ct9H90mP23_1090 [Methanobacteriota archaeon]|nr:MAG: hypothetical protein Ct9H90mP23_1090 [Euryarchaeota archaeon]
MLTSHVSDDSIVAGLFTHQDHVMSVPESCSLLCSTKHNVVTAVRVLSGKRRAFTGLGNTIPPRGARARIERAHEWGHITDEELASFKGEHDGSSILSSFATVVIAIKHNLRPIGAIIVDSD